MSRNTETRELFTLSHSLAAPLLEKTQHPWEILPEIGDFILRIGPSLPPEEYRQIGEDIWIARDVTIAPTATVIGPTIIGRGTEVRPGAYIRGKALIGEECVIGNSTEIKNAVLFDRVQVPHYNYVGDSILGYRAHMGAGAIASNVRGDRGPITVHDGDENQKTGLKKFGTMLGDCAEIGCNSVLCPGSVVGRNTQVYPLSRVRGVIPADSLLKGDGSVVPKGELQ